MALTLGESVAQAAQALRGTPFRLHGRNPATGIDCVGLVLLALRGAGRQLDEPVPYTICGAQRNHIAALMGTAGLTPVHTERAGDIVLVRSGPMQLHLMIAIRLGHVHAHAGLGRVVEMPGESPWPILGRWHAEIAECKGS
jgi:murein DD-endopeptidase / murein LD-carboxypeptidase